MNYLITLLLLPLLVLMPSQHGFAETISKKAEKNRSPARSIAKFPQPRRRFLVTIPTEGSRKTGTVKKLAVSVKTDGKIKPVANPWSSKSKRKHRRRYSQHIAKIAKKYRLDPVLIHSVISVESAFNPNALSHKGAIGLMQLMPGTARRFGAKNPYDPLINIDAGSRYLRLLLKKFGDVRLALAAYNAGEGAVMRYGKTIPPYRETRQYVVKVLNQYDRYSSKYLIE